MSALSEPANDPSDVLIRVDAADRDIGYASKEQCHSGAGLLHRAFSVFVFNPAGEVLLQQRSAAKPLWPLHWANSCCSHPRRGESVEAAARRRLREELALACELTFLYKFEYRASFQDVGTEHELCWVFAGLSSEIPAPNPAEIAAWRYLPPADLTAEIAARPERFTPWLLLEWAEIRARHLPGILARAGMPARRAR
ncbi:MAG: isopentenyl-diphosphate Delta-isomerase [Gammaproteobacteria bacterium]|nr:MAG: isopentenyl-diphosphate Delta-isomerase [Gammaproteobacteria bacterium]